MTHPERGIGAPGGSWAGAAARPMRGWGHTSPSVAQVASPRSVDEVRAAVLAAADRTGGRGLLARGSGRTYGDGAQNGGGVLLELGALDDISIDEAARTARVGAGVRLDALIGALVPRGLFVPVTPGTSQVTLGGMVAADVHGKNHHRDGSLGPHLRALDLVAADGSLRSLRPDDPDPLVREEFWATVGGMGLTGVLTAVTLDLIPIATAQMRVQTRRFDRLGDLMGVMAHEDHLHRYSVAWIDAAASGRSNGRGVLSRGDHADPDELPARAGADPLAVAPGHALVVPRHLPPGLLNRWSAAALNEAWFRRAPRSRQGEIVDLRSFFHPLDGVREWNRAYGPRGFVQYQVVVPDAAARLVGEVLDRLRRAGVASPLAVLKRFGPCDPAPLSFPMPGWTVALDLPAGAPGLAAVLDALDELVVAAGGRGYLAKDSRMSADSLRRGYPRLAEWRAVRDRMDPGHVFRSDLARRLMP